MTEDELLALSVPPMVQVGSHSLNVAVLPHEDGCRVELRHPDVGGRRYRVLGEAVVGDEQGVSDWISLAAPAIGRRLDAEVRFQLRQAGYKA